jgi:hypothetical protein
VRPPPPRRQAFALGALLVLVAVVPLAWALTGGAAGDGSPLGGLALAAVRLGLFVMGAVGLALGVTLLRAGMEDER